MSDTLSGTNYPGTWVREFFANGKGNSILLNQSFPVWVTYTGVLNEQGEFILDEFGEPVKVPQVGVELHIRTASDLDTETPFFSDVIIPSIEPLIGSFSGVFSLEEVAKITSPTVYITIAFVKDSQPVILDACMLRVAGGV